MINHEFIVGRSRTNFLQYTLQINTMSIEKADLITLINYLIDHIHVIYDKYQEQEEDVMWPIVIKVNNQVVIAEPALWSYVFDTLTDGYHYLQKYIRKLVELAQTTEFKMLLQSNEYQFHGGLAFNQYWLWCIQGPLLTTKQLSTAIQLYSVWLSKNDLGFETSQDDCINMIFEHFKLVDDTVIATLLAQRLNNGQMSEKGFNYLTSMLVRTGVETDCCLLKKVINQLFNDDLHPDGSNDNEFLIYQLCAAIYGSNDQCTNEVMDYAKSIAKTELWPMHDFEMKKINYLRQVGDLYWQQVTSQNRYIDTSFHLFDIHTRKWIDYDERE